MATAASMCKPHGKRSAQARSWKPGRRRQPSGARERWKPDRGKTRAARVDAQHDSATGHVSWPGTPGLQGSMHKLMRQSSGNRFDSDCCGLADPAQPVRRALRGAKHRAAGIARRAFPWRQAKRAAPRRGRVGITPSRQDAGWIPKPASTAMMSSAGSAHRARKGPTARWADRTR